MSLVTPVALPKKHAFALSALAVMLFAGSMFLSACLLFVVEPMFTKLVLPRLGGSPAVWSVALVFFQGSLLVGYLYAHVLTTCIPVRKAVLVHLCLLTVGLAFLPIQVAGGWGDPPADGAPLWLLGLFAASIGAPFVALSANGPLLQAWYARLTVSSHRNPYALYGASNLGSFLALLLYPLMIEPLLTLAGQAMVWTVLYITLIGSIVLCGALAWRGSSPPPPTPEAVATRSPSGATAWHDRTAWTALAIVPSGLLVAVTAHLSTDIAAVPLLWIAPLAIFLLTFVLIFRDHPLISAATLLRAQPGAVAGLALVGVLGLALPLPITLIVTLAGFFVCTMVVHGELYRRRPAAARLTEFYACMSLGGVLGGVFTALLAPMLFSGVSEYPLLIVASLLCRPEMGRAARRWLPALLAAGALAGLLRLPAIDQAVGLSNFPYVVTLAVAAGLCGVVALSGRRPAWLVGGTAFAFLAVAGGETGETPILTARSFFGVNRLVDSADGRFRLLYHGTTLHGAERVRLDDGSPSTERPVPSTYYAPGGPLAQAVDAARRTQGGLLPEVGVIGLGSGSMACHRASGERWHFFEIDPTVVAIASDPARFRYLSECAPASPIVVGDARLTIARSAERFGLIVVDAFSSDAVPVHLMTREALMLYLSKLGEHGLVAFHVTNRAMDLAPIVAATAADLGLVTAIREDQHDLAPGSMNAHSRVVAVARRKDDLANLLAESGWRELRPVPGIHAWTDDYSNVVQAIWLKIDLRSGGLKN